MTIKEKPQPGGTGAASETTLSGFHSTGRTDPLAGCFATGPATNAPDQFAIGAVNCAFVSSNNSLVVRAEVLPWAKVSAMLSAVQIGEKNGPGWIPADIQPGARNLERVESISALVLDVEAHATVDKATGTKTVDGPEPPDVDLMIAELELSGWACILHTSHSHSEEHPRYRLTFPLSKPMGKDEIKPMGLHVAHLLGIDDSIDTKCLEASRFYYLPRCPADRIELFRHADIPGEALDVDLMLAQLTSEAEALKAASKARAGNSGSVIKAFNEAHSSGAILEKHGYVQHRKRWAHPASTTGMAGVRFLPNSERVYSSHGCGDPLADGKAHDAFDCFRILDCNGDTTVAVREAARVMGMAHTPQQAPQADFAELLTQGHAQATEPALSDDGRKLRGALEVIPKDAKSGKHTAASAIGMALRHVASGIDEREGAALCAEWDRRTGGASLTVFKKSDPHYCATQPLTIASVFDLAKTHGWKGEQAAQDDSVDDHRNAPKPDPAMLYGLVGDVGRAAAATTEANRYAAAAAHIALLSAGVGRNVYLPVGNVKHHARIFMLHVGRSGRGRKGEAASLTKRIRWSIEKQHTEDSGNLSDPLCGQMHDGGLSTREGLALLIHDGYRNGKEDVLPIEDKRLWVIESEFANVLHQAKRDGNTLSAALRDSWDGVSIRPATKTSRLWASNPHISLTGNITPSELLGLMESRELSNGFANRFLIFWAERERIEPFPQPTPRAVVTDLAERTKAVIRFATEGYPENKDNRPMELSADAQTEYARLYRGELSRLADGEKVAALIERRAPMLLRLAMLFALTDLTLTIEIPHIRAALAWVRFHRDSVRFIFNDAAGETAALEASDGAAKILEYLKHHGQTSRAGLSKDCFSGHLSAKRLDEALDSLLMNTPPLIELRAGEKDERNGKRTKFYYCCETSEIGETGRVARKTAGSRSCEIGEIGLAGKNPTSPTSQACETAGSRADRATSPVSPISHPAIEKPAELVEIEI